MSNSSRPSQEFLRLSHWTRFAVELSNKLWLGHEMLNL
jgi:hypothetical protein